MGWAKRIRVEAPVPARAGAPLRYNDWVLRCLVAIEREARGDTRKIDELFGTYVRSRVEAGPEVLWDDFWQPEPGAPAEYWAMFPAWDAHPPAGTPFPVKRYDARALGRAARGTADWQPPEYRLDGGIFGDYLGDGRGLRLCSDELRDALESARGPHDDLEWLPAWLSKAEERRRYWLLRTPDATDLLDAERSDWWAGKVVRAVIDGQRAEGRAVLAPPDGSKLSLLLSEPARLVLAGAGCTGFTLDPYPCA